MSLLAVLCWLAGAAEEGEEGEVEGEDDIRRRAQSQHGNLVTQPVPRMGRVSFTNRGNPAVDADAKGVGPTLGLTIDFSSYMSFMGPLNQSTHYSTFSLSSKLFRRLMMDSIQLESYLHFIQI